MALNVYTHIAVPFHSPTLVMVLVVVEKEA